MAPLTKIMLRLHLNAWALPLFLAHDRRFNATSITLGPVWIEINWNEPWRAE